MHIFFFELVHFKPLHVLNHLQQYFLLILTGVFDILIFLFNFLFTCETVFDVPNLIILIVTFFFAELFVVTFLVDFLTTVLITLLYLQDFLTSIISSNPVHLHFFLF